MSAKKTTLAATTLAAIAKEASAAKFPPPPFDIACVLWRAVQKTPTAEAKAAFLRAMNDVPRALRFEVFSTKKGPR